MAPKAANPPEQEPKVAEQQSTAVATRPKAEVAELPAPTSNIIEVAKQGDVERVVQSVVIPPIYQYSISRYGQAPKVMLTSDAYDYLNRTMGVQLYQPDWVHDEQGNRVRNPIHRADYIYLRMLGIYWNDLGQMTSYREDVEVDFKLVYMDARINSKSAKVEMDDEGQPKFSQSGMPMIKLDQDDEKRALKALSQLRTFGLRYAQTVAKTRILKVVSGIRTLPIPQPAPFAVRVVGFKDNLTPDQRIKKAEADLAAMFGPGSKVDDQTGLSTEELEQLRDIEGMDATEDIEREMVDAAVLTSEEQQNIRAQDEHEGPIRRVGPEDFAHSEPDLGLAPQDDDEAH